MKKKCPNCQLVNFAAADLCLRCGSILTVSLAVPAASGSPKLLRRVLVCLAVILFAVAGFYLSLISSAKPLSYDERKTVERAIAILDQKGFTDEVFLLEHLTAFRGNDNWLNASVEKENAYAATNFPFEIMTLYPEFFTVTADDTERAAVLLHEAQHLQRANEKEAYEFVWKNHRRLGWTKETYFNSIIWRNVRKQTKEYAPNLFVCELNEYSDCTE